MKKNAKLFMVLVAASVCLGIAGCKMTEEEKPAAAQEEVEAAQPAADAAAEKPKDHPAH